MASRVGVHISLTSDETFVVLRVYIGKYNHESIGKCTAAYGTNIYALGLSLYEACEDLSDVSKYVRILEKDEDEIFKEDFVDMLNTMIPSQF